MRASAIEERAPAAPIGAANVSNWTSSKGILSLSFSLATLTAYWSFWFLFCLRFSLEEEKSRSRYHNQLLFKLATSKTSVRACCDIEIEINLKDIVISEIEQNSYDPGKEPANIGI